MTHKQFDVLLKKTYVAASKYYALIDKVNEECIRRHKFGYLQVGAENIIEAIDFGQGWLPTSEDFDKEMEQRIHALENPKIDETKILYTTKIQ